MSKSLTGVCDSRVMSGVLAAETDERVVYHTLRNEIERVLADFSGREQKVA